ncbi:MAG TPA: DUF4175 family protein [Myxococcota bacterium]|nr:DUF4175 family protein [Myxococcota bacterium]
MSAEFGPILQILRGMVRRERLLSLSLAALGFASGVLLAWSLALGMAAGGVDRFTTRWAVLAVAVLALVALVAFFAFCWRRAGGLIRQAGLLERERPELRGRLFVLLDRQDGLLRGDSEALLSLAAKRARAALEGLVPATLHPVRWLRRPAAATGALAAIWVLLSVLGPMGPVETLRWLGGDASVVLVAPPVDPETPVQLALLGDIVLRYEYPAYTGLQPFEVENTGGTIHAPPGTRVRIRARTGERYDGAALQIGEGTPTLAQLADGRVIEAELVVAEEGTYRFLLQRGATAAVSPDFQIRVEPDTAPIVDVLTPSERMEVAMDDPIVAEWHARDDYGLGRVDVVGRGRSHMLEPEFSELSTEWTGGLGKTPRELGLSPGDELALFIVAWDNDPISGAKDGKSRPIRIVVLGDEAERLRFIRFRRELRDALVDVLADFVTDPSPVAGTEDELVVWAMESSRRFDPLDDLVDEYWDGFDVRSLEGRIVGEVRRVGGGLVRFAMDLGQPGSAVTLDDRDVEVLEEMDEELVALLESYVLMLDRVVQYQALGELERQLTQLEAEARNAELMVKSAPVEETLERFGEMDQRVEDFQKAASDFDSGRLKALADQWGGDLLRLSERIQAHLEAGELDAAELKAGWYAEEAERLRAQLDAMQAEMEEASEQEQQDIQDLIEKIKELEREERELLERTTGAREEHGVKDSALVAGWEEAERLAELTVSRARLAHDALEADSDAWPREQRAGSEALELAERALFAVKARDLVSARGDALRSRLQQMSAAKELAYTDQRRSARGGDPRNATRVTDLEAAMGSAAELEELLDRLVTSSNQSTPALRGAIGGFADEQDGLEQETREIQPKAAELAQKLPMGAPGLEESLAAAVREMQRAESSLARSWVVEAEGAEEAAADRLRQALEALEQAAAAASQMGDAMSDEGSGGGESQGGEDGEGLDADPYLELPADEMSDDEYRQALMEGMQSPVPEEYEALKRRYYEELVRH